MCEGCLVAQLHERATIADANEVAVGFDDVVAVAVVVVAILLVVLGFVDVSVDETTNGVVVNIVVCDVVATTLVVDAVVVVVVGRVVVVGTHWPRKRSLAEQPNGPTHNEQVAFKKQFVSLF
jgi:hypothetical protein